MTFYSKSYIIIIIIIASMISTIVIHRPSLIIRWNQKEERLFQCRNRWKLSHGKRFYNVDCSNPFLKALVEDTNNTAEPDVCNSFNPLYTRLMILFHSFKMFQLTDFNELLKACPQCHHLQVIDGTLYDVPRSTSVNYETRSKNVKSLFQYVVDTFNDIPNMEFLIHVGDSVDMKRNITHPSKCPVFGFAKNYKNIGSSTDTDGIVLIPCFSFWSWSEAGITRWNKKMMSIKRAGDRKTFAKKQSKLFWRGARTGRRTEFISITHKHQQIMDGSFMDWQGVGLLRLTRHKQYRTLEQHCDYKYLLHLEGNTFSGTLKYLLLCGSPVIFAKIDGREEFWYHLLKHQENIITLELINEALLLNLTNYLLENSAEALRIGLNGRNTVLQYLNEQAIICYMKNVLFAYNKLVDYQVVKHENATVKLL